MLDKIKKYSIAGIIASLVLGIIFIVYPTGSTRVVAYIMGGIIFLSGIYDLVLYFRGIGFTLYNRFNLFTSLFKLLVGVLVYTNIDLTVSMFGIFFACYIVTSSLNTFEEAIILKRVGASGWFISMILSIIVMAMGVVMIVQPFDAAETAAIFAGITMIIDAVAGIFAFIKIRVIKQEVLDALDIKE